MSSDQQQQQHWRPTEAQLRWAQFHLVARTTRDSATTTIDEQQQQRLDTSHAAYLQRASTISTDGYRVFCDADEYDETASLVALEQAFVATSSKKKNRRFQAALHALLRTMQATQSKLAQTVEHEPSPCVLLLRSDQLLSQAKEFVHDPEDAATLVQELQERHPELVRQYMQLHPTAADELLLQQQPDPTTEVSLANNNNNSLAHMIYAYYEAEHQVHPTIPLATAVSQYFGVTPNNDDRDPYVDALTQALDSLQGTLTLDATLIQRAMDMAERELQQSQPKATGSGSDHPVNDDAPAATVLDHQSGSVVQAYSAFRRRSTEGDSTGDGGDGHSSMTQSSAFVPSSFRNVWKGIVQHQHQLVGGRRQQQSQPTTTTEDDGSEHKSMEFQDAESLTSFVVPPRMSLSSSHTSSTSALPSPTTRQQEWSAVLQATKDDIWSEVLSHVETHPWLTHVVADPRSQRVLLHTLCAHPTTPTAVLRTLLDIYPSAAYKVDAQGNVPLHCAAAVGNAESIQLLVQAFSSGTSIRNYQGLLPLHVCLQQAAATSLECVVALCNFPQATATADNRGNLPLHTAAGHTNKNINVSTIQYLIQQAEFHVRNHHLRFKNPVKSALDDGDADDDETVQTGGGDFEDDTTNCRIVRNEEGATPLSIAIQTNAATGVVVALTTVSGGLQGLDAQENTALHWLIERGDGETAMAVLETVPEAATVRNEEGVLPIEMACMKGLPQEVILALVLVDLPINLDDNSLRDMFGDSWWYLTCDCNDVFCDVVSHVAHDICNIEQVRSLAFLQDRGTTLFRRATPKCRRVLAEAMRVCDRYELRETQKNGVAHQAIDYGERAEGERVLLRTFENKTAFERTSSLLRRITDEAGSENYFEAVTVVGMTDNELYRSSFRVPHFCSIAQPEMTLDGILRGMLNNDDCQSDPELRQRYSLKVWSILRSIAKALRRLHTLGLVHCHVKADVCGKYDHDERWRLGNILSVQPIGCVLVDDDENETCCAPPEAVEPVAQHGKSKEAAVVRLDFALTPATDAWAYGKLCYEMLVGDDLVPDMSALLHWSEFDIQDVLHALDEVGVSTSGQALIGACLSVDAATRPTMEEIVHDPLWGELRQISGERKSISTVGVRKSSPGGRKSMLSSTTIGSSPSAPRMLV